jgi:hypothetical protein
MDRQAREVRDLLALAAVLLAALFGISWCGERRA